MFPKLRAWLRDMRHSGQLGKVQRLLIRGEYENAMTVLDELSNSEPSEWIEDVVAIKRTETIRLMDINNVGGTET